MFSGYLQDILNFGSSPSGNLNTPVNLFEKDVVGSHTSLLAVEMPYCETSVTEHLLVKRRLLSD